MSHYNRVILSGVVFKNPEIKDGRCKFTLRNDEGYGDKKSTNWFRCIAFNKTAEFIGKYVKDGTNIILDGRVCIRKYQDKFYTEIVVNSVEFNGPPQKQQDESQKNQDNVPDFDQCSSTPDY